MRAVEVRALGSGLLLFLVAMPLVGCLSTGEQGNERSAMYATYYDMEVLSYCSLGGEAATDGHARTVARLLEGGLSQNDHEQARMDAWADAYREWLNRGLGGFKGWCRTEGEAARLRLESVR